MKQIFYSLAILLMGVASCSFPKEKQIIACGDDKAVIIDVEQSTEDSTHIVWRWKVSDAASQLPLEYQKLMVPLDECKPVNGGKEILLTSSGGGALLLDKETKQCTAYFRTHTISSSPISFSISSSLSTLRICLSNFFVSLKYLLLKFISHMLRKGNQHRTQFRIILLFSIG